MDAVHTQGRRGGGGYGEKEGGRKGGRGVYARNRDPCHVCVDIILDVSDVRFRVCGLGFRVEG